MSAVCYIQARGGSKRFPRKNLALWRGVPMLVDAINKARQAAVFDCIIVSSDDPEILKFADDHKAIAVRRSDWAARDEATDDDVWQDVAKCMHKYEYVCKLYPCVPLLKPKTIENMLHHLQADADHDGIYTVDKNGVDAGAVYWFKRASVECKRLSEISWAKYPLAVCQDINTPEDLEIAKKKARSH